MDTERHRRALGGSGILTDDDLKAFSEAAGKIEKLMLDGRWHTATEIIGVSGQREGLRRMRELRRKYDVQRQRVALTREWVYRLDVPPKAEQARLF